MDAKEVVTEEFEWEFDVGNGVVQVTNESEAYSQEVKVHGKKVLTELAKFSVTGYTGGDININGSGSSAVDFTFQVTDENVKAKGLKLLRDGDKTEVIAINGQKTNPIPPPATVPTVQTVTITLRAKQQEVKIS